MEGRVHSSKAYGPEGQVSRMEKDLLDCSKDFKSYFKEAQVDCWNRPTSSAGTNHKLHVGVVGAGMAGLRCAEILVEQGIEVTILEARDRIGGRVCFDSRSTQWQN